MALLAFIHGKNHELSIAEIMAVAGSMPVEAGTEFSVFELPEQTDVRRLASRLGGTLKAARVLETLSPGAGAGDIGASTEKHFHELLKGLPGNKLLFGVCLYGGAGDRAFVEQKIRGLAKSEGMKVSAAHPRAENLSHTEVLQKKVLSNGFELLVCAGGQHVYMAKTLWVHNPFEFRKRDLGRPAQRPIFSIPPRLARTMINLAGARRGSVFMDPFCGIGTILQEAALMGMDIRGIDMKESCIGDARKNLRWLEREYKIKIPDIDSRVRREDARWLSSHFRENSIDAVATEPCMGPPLKRRPDRIHAMRILDGLRPLYGHSLKEILKVLKPGSRVCMVSPAFIVKGRFYGLNIAEMAGRLGGRAIDPLAGSGVQHERPMRDFEERHNTIREIYVVEKAA